MDFFRLTVVVSILVVSHANGARISLEQGGAADLPPTMLRLSVVWTMNPLDTPVFDLDGLNARFDVLYPEETTGQLVVVGVEALPGWTWSETLGIGQPLTVGNFFLAVDDFSGQGVSGNGTEFSTVIASIVLRSEGNTAGTEITFRVGAALPAAYDGARPWTFRWQPGYSIPGPGFFDIGVGNPGDGGPEWDPYHGLEAHQPLVIVPEPSPLAVILLSAVALLRFRR